MTIKQDLLTQFTEWNDFVVSIQDLNWDMPIEQGKWTIHDIVSHIMLWDDYFLENAIKPISNDEPLTLKHLDYDQFNHDAMIFGKGLSKNELIQRTIESRNRILHIVSDFSEDKFIREYIDGDGNPFSVEYYVKDFFSHDRHHMKQIENKKDSLSR